MSRLSIAFLPAARQEFLEASRWFEAKRTDLGREFIAEIERCLVLAAERPLQFAAVRADIRRIVIRRFPYSAETHRIVVMAIFHGHRDPRTWFNRA